MLVPNVLAFSVRNILNGEEGFTLGNCEEVNGKIEMFVVETDMVTIDDQGRMIPELDAIKELIVQLEGS